MIKRRNKGFTLFESLLSSTLIALVVGGMVYAQMNVMRAWQNGIQKEQAQRQGQRAVREIRTALMEAAIVEVLDSGRTLRFRMPQQDSNGNYLVPVVPAPAQQARVISVSTGGDVTYDGRNILRGVTQTRSNGQSYANFTLIPAGANTSVLHVRFNVKQRVNTPNQNYAQSWIEETIFLRNLQ